MNFLKEYFDQAAEIAQTIDLETIEKMVIELVQLKKRNGRLFLFGVGGSAANCSHAVNDFRKICDIETYTPVDNVAELTARTNDDGWDTVFASFLATSRADERDAVMVFSVGGGNLERNVSANIVVGLQEAKQRGLKILGVVGRDGGYSKKVGDAVVVIPTIDENTITPHTEAFQAVVWHGIVCHPDLMSKVNKWESMATKP